MTRLPFSDDFIANYWRKAPCIFKGATHALLQGFGQREFAYALDSARASGHSGLHIGPSTVFIERVDRFSEVLHKLSSSFSRFSSGAPISCDAVRTERAGDGIGSHFDDSDNFVLQLEGSKIWRLHSPDIIPQDLIARRLRKEIGVGSIHMPEDTYTEYHLESGDILYIPLIWPHWGIATGASLSVSVVVNVPPSGKTGGPRDQANEDSRLSIPKHTRAKSEIDIVALKALVSRLKVDVPYGGFVFPASSSDGALSLLSNFSALMIKRLFQAITISEERDLSSASFRQLRDAVVALFQVDPLALARFSRAPGTTAWIYKMHYALQFDYPQLLDDTIVFLGNRMLDLLAQESPQIDRELVFDVMTLDGVLDLPSAGLRLRFDGGDRRRYRVSVGSGSCDIAEGAFEVLEAQKVSVIQLQRFAGTEIVIADRDPLVAELYPKDRESRANPLDLALTEHRRNIYHAALESSLEIVKKHWPEGYLDVTLFLTQLIPIVDDRKFHPNNQSVHAFRGLVATSPRPSYFSAQVWAHESGHNKLSTMLDLFRLVDESCTCEELYSPFVGTNRPTIANLHALFSFARDLEVTRRMLGQVEEYPGYSMECYFSKNLARWSALLATVEQNVKFTDRGNALIDEFRQIQAHFGSH
jgi:HEXXH motif-containing protein